MPSFTEKRLICLPDSVIQTLTVLSLPGALIITPFFLSSWLVLLAEMTRTASGVNKTCTTGPACPRSTLRHELSSDRLSCELVDKGCVNKDCGDACPTTASLARGAGVEVSTRAKDGRAEIGWTVAGLSPDSTRLLLGAGTVAVVSRSGTAPDL